MTIKLYAFPLSSACGRVFVTLYELGLEFELVSVSFVTGEQKAPEYVDKQVREALPELVFFAESKSVGVFYH